MTKYKCVRIERKMGQKYIEDAIAEEGTLLSERVEILTAVLRPESLSPGMDEVRISYFEGDAMNFILDCMYNLSATEAV